MTTNEQQAIAERKYAALKQAVEEAGFFAVRIVGDEYGGRITCTSKRVGPKSFSGRIAFVSETQGNWYIETPHPYHYRVCDSSQPASAVVAFLAESGLDGVLEQISCDEYEQAHGFA